MIAVFCIRKSSSFIYLFSIHIMPPLSDFEQSGNASTLSMLYHNQVCISIVFGITVIITLINLCLSFPCTLKHSYLDRETSLILKNIAGKPSHLLTKVTPPFACFFSFLCMFFDLFWFFTESLLTSVFLPDLTLCPTHTALLYKVLYLLFSLCCHLHMCAAI